MTWIVMDSFAGVQPITTTSTTKQHPLGRVVQARNDSTDEAGEFIYLQGIGSTAVGSIVIWDGNFLTTLATDAALLAKSIAFSMSANVASQYGWYQISGVATAKKTATIILPNVKLYVGADALTATSATGKSIIGLRSANAATLASAITTVEVVCNRPTLSGLLITS